MRRLRAGRLPLLFTLPISSLLGRKEKKRNGANMSCRCRPSSYLLKR